MCVYLSGELVVLAHERVLECHVREVHVLNLDVVPQLSHSFLPSGYLLSLGVVVGNEFCVALSQLVVESLDVVVDHSLHSEARGDLGDRVLYCLNPLWRVALAVLCEEHWDDLVLKSRVDCQCVELVLIALVLECSLLCQSPSCALDISFEPPSVEHREVDNTVHLCLLA